ncbi:MAG TPA: OsmC family protein [Candidatus Dormibacteraeota bacterium]|nr:OsmC family protein [Candidatus Dormibacteraeota bacterium]
MGRVHRYAVTVRWTGNMGSGTSNYRSYGRQYEISGEGSKPVILGSSERIFRGDPARWNPEELLVASIAACHKLWYLHLCATSGITVIDYLDNAEAFMEENQDGSGHFQKVILRPEVKLAHGADVSLAEKLHEDAHAKCFIASSVNFPVEHEPRIIVSKETVLPETHSS